MASTTTNVSSAPLVRYVTDVSTPLSADEERAVRSLPGLVMALVHSNHTMDGQYPSGVAYYLRQDAPVQPGFLRESIGGRYALYELGTPVDERKAQRCMAALKQRTPSTEGYDLDVNAVPAQAHRTQELQTLSEAAPWRAQFDSSRHDAMLVRADNDSGVPDQFLVLRTDAGHAGRQLVERAQGKSIGQVYASAPYRHTVARASAVNANRVAFELIADGMDSQPKWFSRDVLASINAAANEAHPECAEPSVVSEYDVLRHVSLNGEQLVAYYRGCCAPSSGAPNTQMHFGDPLSGGALYQSSGATPLRVRTLPLGSARASGEQAKQQHDILRMDDRRVLHVRQTFEWHGKDSSSSSSSIGAALPERLYNEQWFTNNERNQLSKALARESTIDALSVTVTPLRPVAMHLGKVRA